MKRDVILFIDGANMRGVFSAGFLSGLEEMNFHKRIHSIYSRSSGAHSAAYFLANETKKYPDLFKELLGENFIKWILVPRFLKHLFIKIFYKKEKLDSILDLDFIKKLESRKIKLDIDQIKKSKIKFYVRIFDIDSLKGKYVDGKNRTLKVLRASSDILPFYNSPVLMNGRRYADGGMIPSEMIPDEQLFEVVKKNPDKKIIYVFNEDLSFIALAHTAILHFFWALSLGVFFGHKICFKKLSYLLKYNLTREIISYNNVYPIFNNIRCPSLCRSRSKMEEVYNNGIKQAKNFFKSL